MEAMPVISKMSATPEPVRQSVALGDTDADFSDHVKNAGVTTLSINK